MRKLHGSSIIITNNKKVVIFNVLSEQLDTGKLQWAHRHVTRKDKQKSNECMSRTCTMKYGNTYSPKTLGGNKPSTSMSGTHISTRI